MKKAFFICISSLLFLNLSFAQSKYKAVFELTSEDQKTWKGILGNIKNTKDALKDVEIALVAHSAGISFLTKKNEELQKKIKELADNEVKFYACQNTMEKKGIVHKDLLTFAEITDSGVAEIIRKQNEGWSYVKVGK
jgi:uncharacterized protein